MHYRRRWRWWRFFLYLLRDFYFLHFRSGLPGLRQERRLLMDVLFVGVFEARGDNGNFDGVFHGVILHRAKNNIGIFVRGFLNDAGSFVNFMQREAGAAADINV